MAWMVSQWLYSDVSSCPRHGLRAARLSLVRPQSARARLGLDTKLNAHSEHFSADTYSWTTAAGSQIVKFEIPRQIYSPQRTRTCLHPLTRSSKCGFGLLGPTRSAAPLARLFVSPDHSKNRFSRCLLGSLHAQ